MASPPSNCDDTHGRSYGGVNDAAQKWRTKRVTQSPTDHVRLREEREGKSSKVFSRHYIWIMVRDLHVAQTRSARQAQGRRENAPWLAQFRIWVMLRTACCSILANFGKLWLANCHPGNDGRAKSECQSRSLLCGTLLHNYQNTCKLTRYGTNDKQEHQSVNDESRPSFSVGAYVPTHFSTRMFSSPMNSPKLWMSS